MFRVQKIKMLFFQDRYDKYLKSYPWIFDMYKKEQSIFLESLDFLKNNKEFESKILYAFHWYEALIELFTKYQKEFWFSDEEISNLNLSVDELSITLKHITSWHYESAYVHMRIIMESIINTLYVHLIKWDPTKKWIMKKIKISLKNWDFYWKDVDVERIVIGQNDFFDVDNYYSIYEKLSWFVHKWISDKDLKFKKQEFVAWIETTISLLERSWAFIYLCLWKTIKKYRNNPYEKAEDRPMVYAKPIRYLIVSKWW